MAVHSVFTSVCDEFVTVQERAICIPHRFVMVDVGIVTVREYCCDALGAAITVIVIVGSIDNSCEYPISTTVVISSR